MGSKALNGWRGGGKCEEEEGVIGTGFREAEGWMSISTGWMDSQTSPSLRSGFGPPVRVGLEEAVGKGDAWMRSLVSQGASMWCRARRKGKPVINLYDTHTKQDENAGSPSDVVHKRKRAISWATSSPSDACE
ncbi:hypothetical protein FA13DRAFT_1711634 [Coprinellus micaceus]|uniref:Uncharacterized protein n=1 Tax=Coprinellus micaceus TaxID=71717 RepID=A0A4Y7T368_COPMI|nr:hypothetical protein FA13DRAFT_1711634 [Coprinellus micaceus]